MIRFFLRLLGVGRTNRTVYYKSVDTFPIEIKRVYIDAGNDCIFIPNDKNLFGSKMCFLNYDGTLVGAYFSSKWSPRTGWDDDYHGGVDLEDL